MLVIVGQMTYQERDKILVLILGLAQVLHSLLYRLWNYYISRLQAIQETQVELETVDLGQGENRKLIIQKIKKRRRK